MNSFNHYAHGAIGDWMYRKMAGLDTFEDEKGVGYKHIKIQPYPGGTLTNAKATLQTYYGTASSGWEIKNGQFILDVEVPVNTTATVFLPSTNVQKITESGTPIKTSKDIKIDGQKDNRVVVNLGSGVYRFVINGYKQH